MIPINENSTVSSLITTPVRQISYAEEERNLATEAIQNIKKKARLDQGKLYRRAAKLKKDKKELAQKLDSQRKVITRLQEKQAEMKKNTLTPTSRFRQTVENSDLPKNLQKRIVSFFLSEK